jgi:hypothetical protein
MQDSVNDEYTLVGTSQRELDGEEEEGIAQDSCLRTAQNVVAPIFAGIFLT